MGDSLISLALSEVMNGLIANIALVIRLNEYNSGDKKVLDERVSLGLLMSP
ncbi:MAG: hypothetical protein ACLTA0_05150 [Streptococcus agalactiae]